MDTKTVTIEEVIEKINAALAENEKPPNKKPTVEPPKENIHGTPTDQLPPYVAEIEADLFQKMINNYGRLNGTEPTDDTIQCIRFIARAEAIRRHVYRKLALARLDEFLQNSQDDDDSLDP